MTFKPFLALLALLLYLSPILATVHSPTPPKSTSRRKPLYLNRENFESTIATNPNLFVLFTNNYDGRIEDFLIELFRAKETQESNNDLPVQVGVYIGKLSRKYENELRLFQYPKIIFFANRENYQSYNGGRYAPQILAWMKRLFREMSRLDSVGFSGFRGSSDALPEHKMIVVFVGKERGSKAFKTYQRLASKKNQIYNHSFDTDIARKLILKKFGKLAELEFEAEEKYSKEDPKPYVDNEDYLKNEAEFEDNVKPHDGYWVSKQVTQRGNIPPELEEKLNAMNDKEKKEWMEKEQDANQNLHVRRAFNHELWENTKPNPDGDLFLMIHSKESSSTADGKGESHDTKPINDDKMKILHYDQDLTDLNQMVAWIYDNSVPDYLVDHTEVEEFWKSDGGENFNWMIYIYKDNMSANRNKDRYSKDEDVDAPADEFELEDEQEQEKIMAGVEAFKIYAAEHKRDMKFAIYNLKSNSANMQAIEEWGGSVLEPQVVYLDGLHPVNGKFKRFFRSHLSTKEDFDLFRHEVETDVAKPFFFSEEPAWDAESGKLAFLEDENWPGWIKLTGVSYKQFMRQAQNDVVMFYMNNEDYRSKNMFEILTDALKKFQGDPNYKFTLALIDSEKNEIQNYKYARTPYLAVIRVVGEKRKEYKAVWLDNTTAIERFLSKNLSVVTRPESDL